MKLYIGVLLYLAGFYSCTYDQKVKNKENITNSSDVTNKIIDSLDLTVNPDTAMLSQKIDTSLKKVLIIFTGRAISGKGLLDEEFLENNDIFKELKKYSIYLLYVDERKKTKDSLIFDQKNMSYQQIHFSSSVQPHYITYSNGIKQCEENYLNDENNIIQFLRCQRATKK